jgi:transketolase
MTMRQQLANSIRILAMDAVQNANSGHPGMPMGMADIAEVLWNDFFHHNPLNPHWPNRDRFILSNGHGSMLQYALLHLSGYDLSIDEIKSFRQLHSKTPGHPEYGITPGVETTTGPLGQGLAHAVGMALAERTLAAEFNQPNYPLIDHYTYVFCGDGCLMEGISHEVCSLAGTLGLGKLIAFYDDNGISIDGHVQGWFTDNTPMRFRAYHWHVIENVDGHNSDAIKKAIAEAKSVTDKPTLICCKTIIAYGSPNKANTHESHGAPLGDAEIKLTREALGWSYPPFEIPAEIYAAWSAHEKGTAWEKQWHVLFENYAKAFPALARELQRRLAGQLPRDFSTTITNYLTVLQEKPETLATRKASQNCINVLANTLPELLGGSADLTGSNLTLAKTAKAITKEDAKGNYVFYGVREFGMSAIMCGIALHGGFVPFGGTFLTFCDYARNAVRLAALMREHVIFIYTHDSIGLGEDGPTHQPVEHIGMLRLTPDLSVWRPCDAIETLIAWQMAIESQENPTCLLLSRQNLPPQLHQDSEAIKQGGYILSESIKTAEIIIIATGSEVSLAMQAAEQLLTQYQKHVRVVSMPSVDTFLKQAKAYQEKVLPPLITKRIAVEAGSTAIWYQFVGLQGKVIGIDRFGESAPATTVYQALGITVEKIVAVALAL